MNKKIFLLLFILGLYPHFSSATPFNLSAFTPKPSEIRHLFDFVSELYITLNFRGYPRKGKNFLKLISSNLDTKVLNSSKTDKTDWPRIIARLPEFCGLNLSQTKLQPSSLQYFHHLDQLNRLMYLNLSKNPDIADHISSVNFSQVTCERLNFLNLSFINIQLKDLEGLSPLKALTYLDLSNCELKNNFLKELSQHENIVETLQELNISYNPEIKFDSDLISTLLKFKKLQKLILLNDDKNLSIIYSNPQ